MKKQPKKVITKPKSKALNKALVSLHLVCDHCGKKKPKLWDDAGLSKLIAPNGWVYGEGFLRQIFKLYV
jgi:hypothetical protein